MDNTDWIAEYKEWKSLKPYEIKLLDEGPISQSQAWLLNNMWSEWYSFKNNINPKTKTKIIGDIWDEN